MKKPATNGLNLYAFWNSNWGKFVYRLILRLVLMHELQFRICHEIALCILALKRLVTRGQSSPFARRGERAELKVEECESPVETKHSRSQNLTLLFSIHWHFSDAVYSVLRNIQYYFLQSRERSSLFPSASTTPKLASCRCNWPPLSYDKRLAVDIAKRTGLERMLINLRLRPSHPSGWYRLDDGWTMLIRWHVFRQQRTFLNDTEWFWTTN